MKTQAEERWEHLQQLLAREAAGHEGPVKISSQRTLFGIKSHVEEVIEEVAAEDTQKCLDALRDDAVAADPSQVILEGANSTLQKPQQKGLHHE